jgi:hypothetical protein
VIYGAIEIRKVQAGPWSTQVQYYCYKKDNLPCKENLCKKSRTFSIWNILPEG